VLEGHDWALVDGNLQPDPVAAILAVLAGTQEGRGAILAVTVMPGPQLVQAVQVCRAVRARAPHVSIVWGGYFPTNHPDVVLSAPYVDFVVRSQGEGALVDLLSVLASGAPLDGVPNLSWKRDHTVVHNPLGRGRTPDALPLLPYARLPMESYIHANYLGGRTVVYNSSFGCPFSCGFCAVVPMAHQRWLAQSPDRVVRELVHLVSHYKVDGVQMCDMDFFISETRVREIAERLIPLKVSWWAMGRVDVLTRYSEATWQRLRQSGLRMIFSGAESGSDDVLARMHKGGRASTALTLELAARMRSHGIVPEFSFVLGSPPDPLDDMTQTFEFIRDVKAVNPSAEIVLYIYTPVELEGPLFENAQRAGFSFPGTLDEWVSDDWQHLVLRRGEGLPWVTRDVRRTARDFERVLNAYYPTVTDMRLTPARRRLLRAASGWRYSNRFYRGSYELRALQRVMKYQRPETTGF
jgi:hypothetical protein